MKRKKNNIPNNAERGSPRRVSTRIDARSSSNIKRSNEHTHARTNKNENPLILMGNHQIYPRRQHRPSESVGFARQNPDDDDGRFVTLPKTKNRVRPTAKKFWWILSLCSILALGEKRAALGRKRRAVRCELRADDDGLQHAGSPVRSIGDDHRHVYALDRRIDVDRVS